MTGITDIEQVRDLFRTRGVELVYVKKLSPKQDNDKNQIYFGRGIDAVSALIPATYALRGKSKSKAKKHSDQKKAVMEGRFPYFWMDRDGATYLAPETKLIEYFQYPEVRLSGFIKGGKWAPRAVRRASQKEFGRRIFLFGITPDDEVVGMLLTALEDPLVGAWPELPDFSGSSLLQTIVTSRAVDPKASAVDLLVAELRSIASLGWMRGRQLRKDGSVVDFFANQTGGYTLEALLGVPSNSDKLPDKHGHEIKAYNGGRVSLMTPSPDGGIQQTIGFQAFIRSYGWPAKSKAAVVFNGQHKVGKLCRSTNAELAVIGYDPAAKEISDPVAFRVALVNPAGDVLATWSLSHLASSWSQKHAAAAYVLYTSRKSDQGGIAIRELQYGPFAWVTAGTNVMRLIDGIAQGVVYFDPAHEITSVQTKNRPQWRISASNRSMEKTLSILYAKVEKISLE